jgi:hypothetical protein
MFIVLIVAFCMWGVILPQNAKSQFTPPSQILLQMNALDAEGRIDPSLTDTRCYSVVANRIRYGCTYFDGNIGGSPVKTYPFQSDTVNIYIENDERVVNGETVQLGYLHNVTPHEIAIEVSSQGNKPLSSVQAQAIASRTYAYYHINVGSTIDNSVNKQVYIPYRYHKLTSAQRQRVNEAVSGVFYMTAAGSTTPIRAHFGQDNDDWTQNGGQSYLISVYDPISYAFGQDIGTDNGGMSSRGCSRWGFGHTSSRGPVTSDNPLYPHDNQGYGNFWDVRWDKGFQILAHYYTGIHIRNANTTILTPEYRWNPLRVMWGNPSLPAVPPPMTPNGFYSANLVFQNTGSIDWSSTRLAYQWRDVSGTTVGSGNGISWSLLKGGASPTIVNAIQVRAPTIPGVYTLIIDMQVNNGGTYKFFFDREPGRLWYPLVYTCEVGGGGCTFGGEIRSKNNIFLPIVFKHF